MAGVLKRALFVSTLIALGIGSSAPAGEQRPAGPQSRTVLASGPLRVSQSNPRYFTDGSGRAIYLTGAHTWNNLQDRGVSDPPPTFDFEGHLRALKRYNHNFMRLWVWENARWAPHTKTELLYFVDPLPYARTGPGMARDGRPKFDLTKFSQRYFDRLRARVIAAGAEGIYVSVMLFQGWSIERKGRVGDPWTGHPFHADNNVNGIDGDVDGDGEGKETHTLRNGQILAAQEAYVRKVVDTLHDLDNVLWEISNESHADSDEWQYHMIDVVRRHEATKPKQHPIGMTATRLDTNANLLASPATWISPTAVGGYMHRPPPATGDKVIISDTDHLWGIGGDRAWVWKSFLRGLNPIYMDDLGPDSGTAKKEDARKAMGDTLTYANRVDLVAMSPRPDLASSTYCLAAPGVEYLVYVSTEPHWIASRIASARFLWRLGASVTNASLWVQRWFRPSVTVDLSSASGNLTVEWFDPASSAVVGREATVGGAVRSFTAPLHGDAVLYIDARARSATIRE